MSLNILGKSILLPILRLMRERIIESPIFHWYIRTFKIRPNLIIERMEVEYALSRLYKKQSLTILDIGCHHAELLDILEYHNDKHNFNVVCIEPMKESAKIIRQKMKGYKRIDGLVVEAGISANNEKLTFFKGNASTLFTSSEQHMHRFPKNFENVETRTIQCFSVNNLLKQIDWIDREIDFIKVDVEGKDLEVITSIIDSGIRRSTLMFELPQSRKEACEAVELLNQNGWKEFTLYARTGIYTNYIGEFSQNILEKLESRGKLDSGNILAFY